MNILITGSSSGIGYHTGVKLLKRENFVYFTTHLDSQVKPLEEKLKHLNIGNSYMVMKLDSKYRIVIVLRFYEDMAIDKIAEVLNENVSTVKTRLYKALKLLKIEMNEEALIDERKYFQGS